MAEVPPPPPPPPIVIVPDENPPPTNMGPVPPITLLEAFVEPFVSVSPGGLLKFTLRVNYIHHIEGYGIVPFVWEDNNNNNNNKYLYSTYITVAAHSDARMLHPVALPLGG